MSRFETTAIILGHNVFGMKSLLTNNDFHDSMATIHIGIRNHIMFRLYVGIRGGDHRVDIIGRYKSIRF